MGCRECPLRTATGTCRVNVQLSPSSHDINQTAEVNQTTALYYSVRRVVGKLGEPGLRQLMWGCIEGTD